MFSCDIARAVSRPSYFFFFFLTFQSSLAGEPSTFPAWVHRSDLEGVLALLDLDGVGRCAGRKGTAIEAAFEGGPGLVGRELELGRLLLRLVLRAFGDRGLREGRSRHRHRQPHLHRRPPGQGLRGRAVVLGLVSEAIVIGVWLEDRGHVYPTIRRLADDVGGASRLRIRVAGIEPPDLVDRRTGGTVSRYRPEGGAWREEPEAVTLRNGIRVGNVGASPIATLSSELWPMTENVAPLPV